MGPLTKGLSSREAVYTAHALEQEARYLTGRAHGGASVSGTGLKFVFPTLRRAVPQLLDGDLDLPRASLDPVGNRAEHRCFEFVANAPYPQATAGGMA